MNYSAVVLGIDFSRWISLRILIIIFDLWSLYIIDFFNIGIMFVFFCLTKWNSTNSISPSFLPQESNESNSKIKGFFSRYFFLKALVPDWVAHKPI